jgi:hypothetical protein
MNMLAWADEKIKEQREKKFHYFNLCFFIFNLFIKAFSRLCQHVTAFFG